MAPDRHAGEKHRDPVSAPLHRLADWFTTEALPFWLDAGFDAENGHFLEKLELDGTPGHSGVLRTRTAARQIYVYAHAAALGVAPPGALEAARRAGDTLHTVAWRSGARPGYARSFDRLTGAVLDPVVDLYDQACVLLALAWLSRATGEPRHAARIEQTLAALDRTLAAPAGGWAEDDAGTLPRRQNPHMHLFEACLAIAESTGAPRHVARTGELFGLFGTRFLDTGSGVLREFFGPHWEIAPAWRSERLDPGHMAEWAWLIRRYADLAACDAERFCRPLVDAALALGRTRSAPFLVDEVAEDGTPLTDSRRLWPQTELVKALLLEHRAAPPGSTTRLDEAERLAEAILGSYLAAPVSGTWIDRFDLAGRPLVRDIPASSNYHLWTAVAEVLSRLPREPRD